MKIKTVGVLFFTNLLSCSMGKNMENTFVNATIGDTITLKCPLRSQNLSAQWVYLDTNSVIFDGLHINPKLMNNETSSPKFEITGNPELGEYNLKINDVDIQDKGDYKCDTEIKGKPRSKFFSLVIREYLQNNDSDEYSTEVNPNYQTSEGFSIYRSIMIFMLAIVCFFLLPLVVAGILKMFRPKHGLDGIETDTETAPEFLFETINGTGVFRSPLSGLPSEHTLWSERSDSLYGVLNYAQSRSYATQLSVCIPDIFIDNNAGSETSSTHSLDTSFAQVYEPPYINHYHPLVRSLGLQSRIYYDECSLDISLC